MVSEIRSFLSTLGIEQITMRRSDTLYQTIIHLTELGNTILEPFIIMKGGQFLDTSNATNQVVVKDGNLMKRRRQNSYVLPLELIPTILATMDVLDDNMIQLDLFVKNEDRRNETCSLGKSEEKEVGMMNIRASDKLLLSMFASYNCNNDDGVICFQRILRADALLPLLSLAMDDVGVGRMSSTLSVSGDTTYWDCLKFALNDVIHANLICYSDDNDIEGDAAHQQGAIVEEAMSDEGLHIIPLSDYPALMRCVSRMVATTSSTPHNVSISWGSILLRLYHAAAVATNQTPLSSVHHRRTMSSGGADRLALLSTVESHVLLPSCTGASVDTIRSILGACNQECCITCKQDSAKMSKVAFQQTCATPAWALSGVVLLIMRARSSNLSFSHSMTYTSFGPRAVFRMASDMLLKGTQQNPKQPDDEIGCALSTLSRLSSVRGGRCHTCCDSTFGDDTEKCAYEVLKHCYYAGNDKFYERYNGSGDKDNFYQYELGLDTLSSYANLVRASLNHGAIHDTWTARAMDSSMADTARTWIDAANMLLDESGSNSPRNTSGRTGTVMAIVAIVVVFFEVPSTQDDIVRSIYDLLANMACHNSHSIGGQSDKSCFLLVSVLAWSLVASDGKYMTNNVVRRKDRRDHVTSVLEPLCNLLSKSALSSGEETSHLSLWALCQLARSLAPVPSGREVVLSMALKNLRVLSTSSPYSHLASNFFESLPSTPSASHDAIYLATQCLLILIERCHIVDGSIEDDCGRRALGMISDFIVLQRPSLSSNSNTTSRLPIDVVSWMLCELDRLSRKGKLTKWVSRRLLRACFVSLFGRIAHQESEQSLLQIHFPGMLRLALSLYNDTFDESYTLMKSHLLRSIRLQPEQKFEVAGDDRIERLFGDSQQVLQAGFDPNNESVLAIDGVVLMIAIQSASMMIQQKKEVSPDRAEMMKHWIEFLADAEEYHFQENSTGTMEKHNSTLPSWIKDHSTSLRGSKYQHEYGVILERNSAESKCFHMSLCDIIVEILLPNNHSHGTGVEVDNHHYDKSVLLGVNYVLGCKRRISDETNSSTNDVLLGCLPHNSICSLLELSSQHLRPLLTTIENKTSVLSEVDQVVKNVLGLCTMLSKTTRGNSNYKCILRSYWSMYCSLAGEESSQLLISFVKESYIQKGGWAEQETSPDMLFPLLEITSSDNLDFHIRCMRETILSSFSQILISITEYHTELSPKERKANIELLLQIMPQLCQDFDAAFSGYSGGMGKQLALLFLGAIEDCVDAIAVLFESISIGAQHEMSGHFLSVHQSAVIIWEILRENHLRQASVLKITLKLCIDKMPGLIRNVERVIDKCIVDKHLSGQTCELLEQCSAHLMAKSIIEKEVDVKPEEVSPLDEMGADAMTGSLDIMEGQEFGDMDQALLSKEGNTKRYSCNESQGNETQSKVQMHNIVTTETLPWVCHSSLAAVTSVWNHSYRIISGSSKLKAKSSEDKSFILALRRVEGFSHLHASICRMFEVRGIEPKGETVDMNLEERTTILLAELLSYHGKSSMCSCVEKMAMTLMLAFKQLAKYLTTVRPHNHAQAPLNDAKINESIIFILGWLQSVKAKKTTHDLITGSLLWYIHEKRNFSVASFGKDGSDGYPILGRLPKVLLRLEALEAEIRKLDDVLNGDEKTKNKMIILDQAMSAFIEDKDGAGGMNFRELLSQCIEIVDSNKKAVKSTVIDGQILSEEEESEEDIEGDGITLTVKRQIQRFAPVRKSRRVSLRSRNETIDNWLTLDDDEFGSTPGEKYNVDDGFVDLEDFLVEG